MSDKGSFQAGSPMANPATAGSTFDAVYEEINVPCPTCRGTGRISRDGASMQDLIAMTTDPGPIVKESSPNLAPVDKTIYKRIKDEMKHAGVSQTIFAAVAFNRTQGLLSEILRRASSDSNLQEGKCTRDNLQQIEAFLNKPIKERLRMYAEYRQKSVSQHRLHREYYEGIPNASRRTVISAHARGVLNEYSQQVSNPPDKLALKVLSEALGLQKSAILKYFRKIQKSSQEPAVADETLDDSHFEMLENMVAGSNNELVALIPFSDSRLKPRRTWIWVSIAVGICLLIGGLVLFFLFPRAITIDSNEPMLNTINGSYNTNSSRGDKFVKFTIVNTYNVTNENYFSIDVTNLSSTALLYGNTIVAEAFNSTVVTIPMHSTQPIYLAMDIKFSGEQEYLVDFCLDSRKWVHTQYMAFQLTANTSYLGHSEQVSKATYQRTSCRPPDAPKNSDT